MCSIIWDQAGTTGGGCTALFVWLISQPAVLFSHNKPATNNQPAVLFSQNKSAPAISHQPNEQAAVLVHPTTRITREDVVAQYLCDLHQPLHCTVHAALIDYTHTYVSKYCFAKKRFITYLAGCTNYVQFLLVHTE
jgi:hypothetical protein